jgi:hypothetical protein
MSVMVGKAISDLHVFSLLPFYVKECLFGVFVF